jgi:hypothetical protein
MLVAVNAFGHGIQIQLSDGKACIAPLAEAWIPLSRSCIRDSSDVAYRDLHVGAKQRTSHDVMSTISLSQTLVQRASDSVRHLQIFNP